MLADIFHWSLSNSMSPQIFRTLLSILTDLNNAVVWMVSTHPLIFQSFSPLGIVPRAPIRNGISITFMFHSFFSCLARSRHLSFFSLSFNFTQWLAGTAKSKILQVLFFCCWLFQSPVVWPRLGDPFVSQNPRKVCASHSPGQNLGCAYPICLHGKTSIF